MSGPIGILGGTFDPIHQAHLLLARNAMEHLGLDRVLWIPSGLPGHREAAHASVEDRLAMVRLAIDGESRFGLDSTEALSGSPTYTIDTLNRLRKELGASQPLVFLMGADQLLQFDRWREWRRLPELAHFAVAERPGYPVSAQTLPAEVAAELKTRRGDAGALSRSPAGVITVFPMPPQDLSATAIRARLAAGRSLDDAVPAAVLDYIRDRKLYLTSPP